MSVDCGCGGAGPIGGCGCCEGTEPATPRSTANPPGRAALEYRVGTHGTFMATMLARLSGSDSPELHALTARTGDDAAIALLDAWATVGDVLTFYQERIANEGFLRTATERRSILEAARLVAYELRPGVAASVHLAYTLDKDLKGRDTVIAIPKGSRATSVPTGDELPQPFETAEDLTAGSAWNNLEPRLWRPVTLVAARAADLGALYFDGVSTGLKPGDVVLLVFGRRGDDRVPLKVKTVTPEQIVRDPTVPPTPRTAVTFQQPRDAVLAGTVEGVAAVVSDARAKVRDEFAASRAAVRADADVLEPLEKLVGEDPAADELAAALDQAVTALRERAAVEAVASHTRVAEWLDDTAERLGRQRRGLGAPVGTAAGPAPAPRGFASHGAVARGAASSTSGPSAPRGGATGALGGLVGALKRRPPAQPASQRELERSPAKLFGPGSDIGPRMLAAFTPEASESLYEAWGNAEVARRSPLGAAYAMRVKAAPFGATAPPRSTPDGSGGFVTDEWPLQGAIALGVRVGVLGQELTRIALSAEVGGQLSTVERNATSTNRVTLRPGTASVRVSENEVTVKFGGKLPRLTVDIAIEEAGAAVRLSDDQKQVWRPRPGEVLRHTRGGHRITVALRPSQALGGRTEISVTDEVPQPPARLNVLALDAQYDQIVPGGWVVIDWGRSDRFPVALRITDVETVAKTAYGLSTKVTQLTLSDSWLRRTDLLLSAVRGPTVYAQSETLDLAYEPVDDDVGGDRIELGRLYEGLEAGRWIVVEGERTDIPGTTGVKGAEVAMIAGVVQGANASLPGDKVHTGLLLARPLGFTYKRSTVKIWGNVVKATHGETRVEVLGSGDARKELQEFGLRAKPLTYVAAPTALGAEAELDVRVDRVRWHKAPSLALLSPDDRSFVTRTADDDATSVLFGDGRTGARLPSGAENVQAEYRTGVGSAGNVRAGEITTLQTRPLSVSGVVNPVRASGGADRDTLERARRNAPLGVQALDRLVSVPDYEDFARARAGIGKANARSLSDGTRRVVHVTIAGAGDVPVDPASDLVRMLRVALREWGQLSQPFEVAIRELVLLVVSAGVEIHPDYRWDDVEPRLRSALLDAFCFDRRELGQGLALSEVQAAMQAVRGVVAVDVDALSGVPGSITAAQLADLPNQLKPPPASHVAAHPARFVRETRSVGPGETLTDVAAAAGIDLVDLVRLNPGLVGRDPGDLEGATLVVERGIRPAQLVLLSPAIPDTLILREVTR